MSSTNPAPQTADALTLATLGLCTASYLPDIATIPAAVQTTPPLATGGQWQCIWGPVQDSDESNLALVAGYFPNPNAGPQTICVTLRGTGQGPEAAISPDQVKFGRVLIGTDADPRTVTIFNTGLAPLTVTSVTVSGADATAFTLTGHSGKSLRKD